MSIRLSASDRRFRQVMTDGARRILASESPYEVAVSLMSELAGDDVATAEFSGAAYAMWGWLTDGIDGPPRYARGLTTAEMEDLMRLAAKEWLELDHSPENVRRYLVRWEGWPDSARQSPEDC